MNTTTKYPTPARDRLLDAEPELNETLAQYKAERVEFWNTHSVAELRDQIHNVYKIRATGSRETKLQLLWMLVDADAEKQPASKELKRLRWYANREEEVLEKIAEHTAERVAEAVDKALQNLNKHDGRSVLTLGEGMVRMEETAYMWRKVRDYIAEGVEPLAALRSVRNRQMDLIISDTRSDSDRGPVERLRLQARARFVDDTRYLSSDYRERD